MITQGLVAEISGATLWRWLSADALRPWRHRSWIFPRDPDFATKAGRILDLYDRVWQGRRLADPSPPRMAKSSISPSPKQPMLFPAPGRPQSRTRVLPCRRSTHRRLGVHRAKVFGRSKRKPALLRSIASLRSHESRTLPIDTSRFSGSELFRPCGQKAVDRRHSMAQRGPRAHPRPRKRLDRLRSAPPGKKTARVPGSPSASSSATWRCLGRALARLSRRADMENRIAELKQFRRGDFCLQSFHRSSLPCILLLFNLLGEFQRPGSPAIDSQPCGAQCAGPRGRRLVICRSGGLNASRKTLTGGPTREVASWTRDMNPKSIKKSIGNRPTSDFRLIKAGREKVHKVRSRAGVPRQR